VRITLTQPADVSARMLRSAGLSDITVDDHVLSVAMATSPLTTPEIVRRLVEAGAGVESVIPEEPPLEDVYLKLLNSDGEAS
jgi:hypothetical protein